MRIEKLLDSTVSYKDVPVMKDLLVIQKKIRKILDDWLNYCRNSLGILDPEMYILPDLPIKKKETRFDENHVDFEKVAFYRRKSRSAENLTVKYDLFRSMNKFSTNNKSNSKLSGKQRPKMLLRSNSEFISNY